MTLGPKEAGLCSVCDAELFDIVRYPPGHALAGYVHEPSNPRADAMRVFVLYSSGSPMMVTLCVGCCDRVLAGETGLLRIIQERSLRAAMQIREWRGTIGPPLFPPLTPAADAAQMAELQALASQCLVGILSVEDWIGFEQRTGLAPRLAT